MLAVHVPLFQKVDCPLVHSHWADRQDEDQLAALLLRLADLHGDLVAHIRTEFFEVFAGNRPERGVPERLRLRDRLGRLRNAGRDLFNVPALWENFCKIRAFQGIRHIHSCFSFRLQVK